MLDFSSFYYSISGCSATIIAIIGGFIASKLISINSDRDNILERIKGIDDELQMKRKQHDSIVEELDEDDALDFIKKNISKLVDQKSFLAVYKSEEKNRLDYAKQEKYWLRALEVCKDVSELDNDQMSDRNSDDVPGVLAEKYSNNFEYVVCEKIIFELKRRDKEKNFRVSLGLYVPSDTSLPMGGIWYHEKRKEAEKMNLQIEELSFERKQYEEKKQKIRKPKGMKLGLAIFIVFSLLGVLFPLACALIYIVYEEQNVCIPIISFCLFIICVVITFLYLVSLLRWKISEKNTKKIE